MKNQTLVIFLFLCTFWSLFAQENKALIAGENLQYRIHLGFINAAEATIKSSPEISTIGHQTVRKVEIEGKTTGVLELFSPLRDYWSAQLDTESLFPLKTEMRKREGRYRKQETVLYQMDKGFAKITSPQNKPVTSTISGSKDLLDLISAYYFLRSKPVSDKKPGSRWSAQVLVDSKIYELVLVVRAKETIETESGKRASIKTNILLPKNNLFKEEDAIRLWISDDAYQVPLKVQVNLKIGFLTIDLIDYTILGKKIYFPKASL
ncbi:DUF3108 domain-containing protein [Aquirufa antheringensis]|jgi:hypothetical protein|uniref:DUF3108 domain-containing protein n=1 Tax=Aquirufa antheringensis TaxID=2516559 RepID=A0A4Q9BDA7_9BACT|nr:DUF3108 domain-containing protein [Aquirufa antheringensis]MCZ2486163.1 DUF3108 domain-containing protein [Aquirufa antheringensis]MCZ2489056.1 DUF3108 domain-containing protein [Aquirufa antheringensis]TBH73078.1 DUF3108 domain-containing protein [Aquirufa antheringensis]